MEKMTLAEKISLCEGKNFWETKAFPEHGLSSMFMCDGPHGLRKQENEGDHLGVNASRHATCFPPAVTTAGSWDMELLGKIGEAIAEEAEHQGVGVVLGPGANIKRNPLCGRNFEYFSEDPYLAGKLAAAFITGAQEKGIGTSLKHFACNSQEYRRFNSDSILDERTLREIYLTAFEIAVKEGRPKTVMCAYNMINGVYCSDNEWLLTTILRDEWGFEGLVVTDWGAMNNRVEGFRAGCDLLMPGGSGYMERQVCEAVEKGELDMECVERSARRVVELTANAQNALKNKASCDYEAHHELARLAAESGAVLLKNEDGILPLSESQKIAVVGNMAKDMRYQGAGSSHINPTRLVNPAEVLESGASVESADVAVVFAGLPPEIESEGFDRENMKMPPEQLRLIEETAAKNPNTVVVLFCGAPVEAQWAEKVKAVLFMGLPGQAGGEAVRNLLYGKANPSGKLAETWPEKYADCPSSQCYAQRDGQYREGIYVGYRYYDKAGVKPRWRMGFGLSYTSFAYSGAKIDGDSVRVTVTNTGSSEGAEIVQLYIAPPQDGIYRPLRELKRFSKVRLAPGESVELCFELDDRCFAVWDGDWVVPGGTYTVLVGGNPEALTEAGQIEKTGDTVQIPRWQSGSWYEKPLGRPGLEQWEEMLGRKYIPYIPQKGSFTMNDSVGDMKEYSFVMKMACKGIEKAIAKIEEPGSPNYRMIVESSVGGPLRSMLMFSGMKESVLKGVLEIVNGRAVKGLGIIIKGK